MKRFLYMILLILPLTASTQNMYNMSALFDNAPSGSARFLSMGGSMSALGADISTMATNPAGTALYRSWDMSMSASANSVTNNTLPGGNRSFTSYGSFDNLGIVMANKMSNEDIVRFVNFGVNYRNVKRFGNKMGMSSYLNGLSQTGQMAWQAFENLDVIESDFDIDNKNSFYNYNYYGEAWVGWLTLLGADGRLIDGSALNGGSYYPSDRNSYTEKITGGINAYDFNLSFNLIDAVYFGITFSSYDVDRNIVSSYTEYFDGGEYTLDNYYTTTGSGYDFKFGAIIRPFDESSFRIGVSATTPTVYSLRDYNSAVVRSEIPFYDEVTGEEWTEQFSMDTQSKDAFGGDCYTDYTMIAPAKVNVSLGGTIGTSLALGAEYEYCNKGAIKLFYDDGNENTMMNSHTADNFNAHHAFRLGAEKMFAGSFYTRLGYNHVTGGYKSGAWKMIPINSVQTNTAYKNIIATNNYTCGIGYRGDSFYADAALLYSKQSADFYPFDDPSLASTQLNRQYIKGTFTLGFRF